MSHRQGVPAASQAPQAPQAVPAPQAPPQAVPAAQKIVHSLVRSLGILSFFKRKKIW